MVLCSAPWYSKTRWMSFIREHRARYPTKMASFKRLSATFRTSMESVTRVTAVPSRVGSRKKRPMDMPMPRITARVTTREAIFSLPSRFSSHSSNLEGSSGSASSSSG